ncbi:hypothetical protein ACHAWT_001705 [Skeletonema menzelii]
MPPPPPNFLPAAARRNRRPLDPTRHLQSRELWNKVRLHASDSSNINGGDRKPASSWLYYKSLIQAVIYEIQPFRIKPCYHRLMIFLREEDGLRQVLATSAKKTIYILGSIQSICRLIYNLLQQYCTIQSIQQHKRTIGKAILIMIGLKLYHRTLLYLHELLHAGPILIILTLFILLYTIGLGDNTGASSGVPSAYSVFNRGMRRILGTVDAEDLARQYAGGAAVAAMGGGNNIVNRRDVGEIWVPHDDDDDSNGGNEDDENRLRNERRRQRRLERLQRRNNQETDANDNNNEEDVDEQVNNDAGNDLDDDDMQNHNIQNHTPTQADGNAAESNVGGARKTGKKARRRNLELRREMQRQRQAAAANGFGRGDDAVAMDRLIGDIAE